MSASDNYPMGTNGSNGHFNWQDAPECMNEHCMATLEPDWEFCPYCGWHIDWDEIERLKSGEDWYAEEGEAFYRAECIGGVR